MDETPFRHYRQHLVRDYAADKVRAGVWSPEESEDKASKEIEGLLPEGTATPSGEGSSSADVEPSG